MTGTVEFAKPQWHSAAHFPHSETAEKNPACLNARKLWGKSKQAFICCLNIENTKQNTFHAKLRALCVCPPPSQDMFYTTQKHHLSKILFSCR